MNILRLVNSQKKKKKDPIVSLKDNMNYDKYIPYFKI